MLDPIGLTDLFNEALNVGLSTTAKGPREHSDATNWVPILVSVTADGGLSTRN